MVRSDIVWSRVHFGKLTSCAAEVSVLLGGGYVTVPPVTDEVQPAAPTHRFLPGVEHSGASSAVRGLLRTVCPPHCQWCTTGSVPQTFVELFILRRPTTAGAVTPDHHQVLPAPRYRTLGSVFS